MVSDICVIENIYMSTAAYCTSILIGEFKTLVDHQCLYLNKGLLMCLKHIVLNVLVFTYFLCVPKLDKHN